MDSVLKLKSNFLPTAPMPSLLSHHMTTLLPTRPVRSPVRETFSTLVTPGNEPGTKTSCCH